MNQVDIKYGSSQVRVAAIPSRESFKLAISMLTDDW